MGTSQPEGWVGPHLPNTNRVRVRVRVRMQNDGKPVWGEDRDLEYREYEWERYRGV